MFRNRERFSNNCKIVTSMSDIMNRFGGQRNIAVIDIPSDWQTTGVVQSAGEFSSKNRQRSFFLLHVNPHYCLITIIVDVQWFVLCLTTCYFPYFYPNLVFHGTFGRTEIQVDLWKRANPEVINGGFKQWMIRYRKLSLQRTRNIRQIIKIYDILKIQINKMKVKYQCELKCFNASYCRKKKKKNQLKFIFWKNCRDQARI